MITHSVRAVAARIVARGGPAIILDTCSIADLLREPHLHSHRLLSIEAGTALLAANKRGGLTFVAAQTVSEEWLRRRDGFVDEFRREMQRLDGSLDRIHRAARRAGTSLPAPAVRYTGHGAIAAIEKLADDIYSACEIIAQDPAVGTKAWQRTIDRRRPAQPGKPFGDANIIEHCLAVGREVQRLGGSPPIVFVSSNTSDYCGAGGGLHPDLVADFGAASMAYGKDLGWARAHTGL